MNGQTSTCESLCNFFTFPFKVVAANSFASAVASEADKIKCVVDQASGYSNVSIENERIEHVLIRRTDFWNFSRYSCACAL